MIRDIILKVSLENAVRLGYVLGQDIILKITGNCPFIYIRKGVPL